MNKLTPETIKTLRDNFLQLEEAIEKIGSIIHPNSLIDWAEDISCDPDADQEQLDIASEILEFSDRFCI